MKAGSPDLSQQKSEAIHVPSLSRKCDSHTSFMTWTVISPSLKSEDSRPTWKCRVTNPVHAWRLSGEVRGKASFVTVFGNNPWLSKGCQHLGGLSVTRMALNLGVGRILPMDFIGNISQGGPGFLLSEVSSMGGSAGTGMQPCPELFVLRPTGDGTASGCCWVYR